METETIREEYNNGVARIVLNRPDQMNALNGEMLDFLWHTFYSLRHRDDVRVVILTGAGERAFCAGADLKERRGMSEAEVRKRIDDFHGCFSAIAGLPKPVICALNGYAFGGGLEMALACDIRLVREDTQIGLTEVGLGIIPGAGGTQRLARLVGASRAKEMIFQALRISGTQAAQWGVANAAYPADRLIGEAEKMAERIAALAPIAMTQAKIAIDAGIETDLQTGLTLESRAYAVTIPTEDRREGLEAFRERRQPHFTGQ